MNYKTHYDALIQSRKLLGRVRGQSNYCEQHHITPRCMGGSDNQSNLVMLTAKEHFLAHKLLVKIYPDVFKLWFAMAVMIGSGKYANYSGRNYEARKRISSAAFKTLWACPEFKAKMSKKHKETWTDDRKGLHAIRVKDMWACPEFKAKMSEICTDRWADPEYKSKMLDARRETMASDEYRETMSLIKSGEGNGMYGRNHSEEAKLKMSLNHDSENTSNRMLNSWDDPDFKAKRSASMKGIQKKEQICPHCKFVGRGGNMIRYHFDNCKSRT